MWNRKRNLHEPLSSFIGKEQPRQSKGVLPLTDLASDNKSKALKLALNHLGLSELAGKKGKVERENKKGKTQSCEREGGGDPDNGTKEIIISRTAQLGCSFDKHNIPQGHQEVRKPGQLTVTLLSVLFLQFLSKVSLAFAFPP